MEKIVLEFITKKKDSIFEVVVVYEESKTLP